ncbi:MAG: putative RNA methyltransferase [Halieaceae bacterium]
MSFAPHPALRCPLCKLPLKIELATNSLCCGSQHSFDIARQGYVNLLGAQDKRSRDPGDSKAMIRARRDFLEAAYYQQIAAALQELLPTPLAADALVVDAGCGEGYYLQQLATGLGSAGQAPPSLLGFDISKWALQAAARRMEATWLVASNRNIPLEDQSVDVLLSLFGFPDYASFQRVLKPGGLMLVANSGPEHLLELREVIYPRIKEKPDRQDAAPLAAGFSRLAQQPINYRVPSIDQQAISQLLIMTPHLFRATAEGKQRAADLSELALTVDVELELWQKAAD